MFHDYLIAQIRTYVPLAVGGLVTWLLSLGVDLGAQAEVGLITFGTALITGLYYTAASAIQRKWPTAGRFLLGSKMEPTYTDNSGGGAAALTVTPNRLGDTQ